jgi:hypothetical protein
MIMAVYIYPRWRNILNRYCQVFQNKSGVGRSVIGIMGILYYGAALFFHELIFSVFGYGGLYHDRDTSNSHTNIHNPLK